MTWNHKKAATASAASLTLGLLLLGCADSDEGTGGKSASKPSSSSAPHGYIPGAQEAAEQQSRLVLGDSTSGTLEMLDLIEEKTKPLGRMPEGARLLTDGRFAYAASGSGTKIFDSGAWMVDHGDHVHYYRAKTREIGTLRGKKPEHVHSSPSLTAVTFAGGSTELLDHAQLEKGRVKATATLGKPAAGPVVPLEDTALVPAAGPGGETVVEVRDRHGKKKTVLRETCPDLRGAAVTRTGAVFGCADGALFVSEKKGEPHGEKIPFGRSVPDAERPTSFRHRSLGSTLTAKAGEKGVWVLDVPDREWKLVETGPVTAVNSAGEGTPLLALDDSGTLTSYDISSGEQIADRKLLSKSAEDDARRPVIEVDSNRAYVNDVAAKKVYEIDYNDDLRKARSFSLDVAPSVMVETGR
ncbi:hypothetical protein MMF93_27760 [Streptomyces tubbatahanensis]|uniref:Lipoprotein n=1 Tax=Streptomyces tubbatahanensis TaxID=2923272 RepID=A0ABY3XZ80_9ACTN|nr:hypothetical protein [Streptomyces tubbatahanensis]UNS99821.1 hypothetical protein MMF93_27760 [Streptomyces tubbatahanensis]